LRLAPWPQQVRGQGQRKALQSILAMTFVLSGAKRGELLIEARGVWQDLPFTGDPVTAEPIVEHERSEFVAKVPHGHWKTMTFVTSLRHDRLEAP
jgi:hypothetical protein